MSRWLLVLLALAPACTVQEPPVSRLIGPDGARVYHVSCADSEARCFQLAGESCPFGYDYAATPQRNLLVRCKAAMAPNPYLAFSDPPRPLADRNPYTEKLLPNPYSAPNVTPAPAETAPPLGPQTTVPSPGYPPPTPNLPPP
jgi:hypothetical protein